MELNVTYNEFITEEEENQTEKKTDTKLKELSNFINSTIAKYFGSNCQRITLILICILIIVVIWSSYILPIIYFVVILSAGKNTSTGNNSAAQIPAVPAVQIRIQYTIGYRDTRAEYFYIGLNELVAADNNTLVSSFVVPERIMFKSYYTNTSLFYYPEVFNEVPVVEYALPYINITFNANSIQHNATTMPIMFFYRYSYLLDILNITVQCPKEFEYKSFSCQYIATHCDISHPTGEFGVYILRIGLPLFAILGIILSVVSNLTFVLKLCSQPVRRKPYSFLKEVFESLLTPILFNMFVFASVCILIFFISDIPDPSQTYCEPSNVWSRILGPLYFIVLFGFMISVSFILLNLFLTITFPFAMRTNIKLKVIIYLVETLVSIGIPAVLSVIPYVRGIKKYEPYYGETYTRLFLPQGIVYLYQIYISLMLIFYSILTIITLILVKLRWNYIRTYELKQVPRKLTNLEFRIMLYTIVLIVNIIIIVSYITIATKLAIKGEYARLSQKANCTTARSPAIRYQDNTEMRYDSVLEIIMMNYNTSSVPEVYEQACNNVDKTNNQIPPVLFLFIAFLQRILVVSIFIVTLPTRSNFVFWKKITKKLKIFSFRKERENPSTSLKLSAS